MECEYVWIKADCGLCKSKTSTYLYLLAQSFMSTTTLCVCGRRGLRFKFSSDANIWVTNKKTRKCSWSEASRRIRTIKKFRFNTDADLVYNFYLIMKKNPGHAEMNKVLTKFYVWYMYSSTSCIVLINCKRGVNKQVLFKLWVNINIIFSFLYNAGQAYKHARVCYNENSSWRDEILQYIDKNYAKCVSKVLVL